VTLSRTTIRFGADRGFDLRRTVRVMPESLDGAIVEIYEERGQVFHKVLSESIPPGERRLIQYSTPAGRLQHVVIRIDAGPYNNEQGDRVIWE